MMLVVRDWQEFHMARKQQGLAEKQYFAVALGNFDGLHLGHQQLIQKMVAETKAKNGHCAVLSFSPHPMELIHGHMVPKLMSSQEKEAAISGLGVDGYILQNFDWTWMKMPAENFIHQVLIDGLGADHIYIGFNHSFGFEGKGNAAYLKELAEARGVGVTVIPPVKQNGEIISSSVIRQALAQGNIEKAEAMLGYPFAITGQVVRGRQLGRVFGFPTANIYYPEEIQPILPGVYGVKAKIDGKIYPAVANCGYQPTIDANNKTMVLEVHVLDEDMDLYDKQITAVFVCQIRPEVHFADVESLKRQVFHDMETARKLLK